MRLAGCELRRVRLPLVAPFETSYGVETCRDALLVRVVGRGDDGDEVEGWGECVAMAAPSYTAEYVDGAAEVLRRFLLPALGAAGHGVGAADVATLLAPVKGHPMAKAALEMAVLDAECRLAGRSLASYLGASRSAVPAGVSVGIVSPIGALLDAVEAYLEEGYLRVKLKVRPGWDTEPLRAVRERWPDVVLQVDANGAYVPGDLGRLRALDAFGLTMIEQPLAEDDLAGHVHLAAALRTPICLDESITSARAAAEAIAMGACSVVNLKAGRVGGYLEAVRVHDACVRSGAGLWCGGMLETGLGRAANVALAGLPGFTLPGDVSASGRYFVRDIAGPFVLEEGHLAVPTGPGLGVEILPDILAEATSSVEWVPFPAGLGRGAPVTRGG
ncbi:MAG: o-succinylbenzoate synthase [Acidimicrobiales bacterium]